MPLHRLHLAFEDLDALRAEFERNIAMCGAFVPTSDPLELRSVVEVVIELLFCGESVVLEAEVVHLVAPENALNPGDAGAAVSFLKSASELQEVFARYLEEGAVRPAPTGTLDEPEAGADNDTRFDVLVDGVETAGLSAIEASVVELAGAGLGLARIVEIIPEETVEVQQTINALVERGVLRIRGAVG